MATDETKCTYISAAITTKEYRVYFTPLNDTVAAHIHRGGIYIRQQSDFKGFPVYKHERLNEYLYYLRGNLFGGYWAIGDRIGGADASLSVQTTARRPEDAQESWHAWDTRTSSWVDIGAGRMSCVRDDFMTCSSGEIQISGLDESDESQLHRMGTYQVTNQTNSLRPVYSMVENAEEYFFYQDGIWIIGPTVGTISGGLFTRDEAWKPEHIIAPWVLFTGRYFKQVPQIAIKCKEYPSNSVPYSAFEEGPQLAELLLEAAVDAEPEDSELYTTKSPRFTTMRSPGARMEERTDACNPTPCKNDGHCELTTGNSYVCTCPAGFFGPQCNTVRPMPLTGKVSNRERNIDLASALEAIGRGQHP
ncbi:hypothetical protein CAPTEDRAFT_227712 [Capitella teleta]|uniref:EGF-like domain-containing protein n=1 Tax=Capitella teleta TaxID=283909 RepID=R7U930_CAPTE|nr:hypothetical protein CAPTEDRAFT_227712 [Capitella teleta]|eukprot:ELT99640.1 hypothetical protein CAPTEDRAFT_227712 [Capitella teleta]